MSIRRFGVLTRMLATGQLKFKDGLVFFGGTEVMMISIHIVNSIYEEVKNRGVEEIEKMVYTAARVGGRKLSKDLEKRGIKRSQVIENIFGGVPEMGWGRWKWKINYNTGEGEIIVKNSPFTRHINLKEPVCHMTRGAIAGVIQESLKKEVECLEVECAAVNKTRCRFIVAPKEKLRKIDENLFKTQII